MQKNYQNTHEKQYISNTQQWKKNGINIINNLVILKDLPRTQSINRAGSWGQPCLILMYWYAKERYWFPRCLKCIDVPFPVAAYFDTTSSFNKESVLLNLDMKDRQHNDFNISFRNRQGTTLSWKTDNLWPSRVSVILTTVTSVACYIRSFTQTDRTKTLILTFSFILTILFSCHSLKLCTEILLLRTCHTNKD